MITTHGAIVFTFTSGNEITCEVSENANVDALLKELLKQWGRNTILQLSDLGLDVVINFTQVVAIRYAQVA